MTILTVVVGAITDDDSSTECTYKIISTILVGNTKTFNDADEQAEKSPTFNANLRVISKICGIYVHTFWNLPRKVDQKSFL